MVSGNLLKLPTMCGKQITSTSRIVIVRIVSSRKGSKSKLVPYGDYTLITIQSGASTCGLDETEHSAFADALRSLLERIRIAAEQRTYRNGA